MSLVISSTSNTVTIDATTNTVTIAAPGPIGPTGPKGDTGAKGDTGDVTPAAQAAQAAAEAARDAASGYAADALASAGTAVDQAGIAANAADDALNYKNYAYNYMQSASAAAGTATTQAGYAAISQAAASASENNANLTLQDFARRYLGAKTSDPTTDNEGGELIVGAEYWNITSAVMKTWTGSAWVVSVATATPSGTAGGGLTGTYPDPTLGTASFGTAVQATGTAIAAGTALLAAHVDHVHTPGTGTIGTAQLASGFALAQGQITNLVSDLSAKAPLASPSFSGTPSLPTGTTGVTQTQADNSTKIATTAYVDTGLATKLAASGATSPAFLAPAYLGMIGTSTGAMATGYTWGGVVTVPVAKSYRYALFRVVNQSGNFVVSVHPFNTSTGVASAAVMTSGTIAVPAAGVIRLDLGSTTLSAGTYLLCVNPDNNTATFARAVSHTNIYATRTAWQRNGAGAGTHGTSDNAVLIVLEEG